jgi:hypothetical protein
MSIQRVATVSIGLGLLLAEGCAPLAQPKNSKQEKPGFFKSLFQPEPPPPPKTIKDWMSLERVQP